MADYKPIGPIKLSGRALYDDEQMIRPIKLSGRASYDAGQIPRAELPGRERGSRAAELRAPAQCLNLNLTIIHVSLTCARRVPLTSGDIRNFLVQ